MFKMKKAHGDLSGELRDAEIFVREWLRLRDATSANGLTSDPASNLYSLQIEISSWVPPSNILNEELRQFFSKWGVKDLPMPSRPAMEEDAGLTSVANEQYVRSEQSIRTTFFGVLTRTNVQAC